MKVHSSDPHGIEPDALLSDLGEKVLIRRITGWLPPVRTGGGVQVGLGDDCAVVNAPDSAVEQLLLKADAVVEGVHFTETAEPERVGWKAAGRVLSDFAAMGGRPGWLTVTLMLRKETSVDWIERLYRGMRSLAERHPFEIVGGETVCTSGPTAISIAGVGLVAPARLTLRSGAQPGDCLCVTGGLGGSILGRHLEFEPRLREAEILTREFKPTAMIDISDGLAWDAIHMGEASGVGMELWGEAIPVSPAADELARGSGRPALEHALFDGEDFELLVALPEGLWQAAGARLKAACGTDLTMVGRCLGPGAEFALRRGSVCLPLVDAGWDHFRSGQLSRE